MWSIRTIATRTAGKTSATKPKCLQGIGAAIPNAVTKLSKHITLFTWNAEAIDWYQLAAGKWQAFTSFHCAKSTTAMLATLKVATKMQRIIHITGSATRHRWNAGTHLSTIVCWFQDSVKRFAGCQGQTVDCEYNLAISKETLAKSENLHQSSVVRETRKIERVTAFESCSLVPFS